MFITITTPRLDRNAGTAAKLHQAVDLVGEVGRALLSGPRKVYENRRLLSQLAQMGDHELTDIGLSRQDVVDTTALSLSSDVGVFLASRARDRARHR